MPLFGKPSKTIQFPTPLHPQLDIYQIWGSGWVSAAGSEWSVQASPSRSRLSCGWLHSCPYWPWLCREDSQYCPEDSFFSSGMQDHRSEPTWTHLHWGMSWRGHKLGIIKNVICTCLVLFFPRIFHSDCLKLLQILHMSTMSRIIWKDSVNTFDSLYRGE